MTLSDFQTLVSAYTDAHGEPYVEGTAQYPAINRALERFTEECLSLYDDDIALTTATNTDSYALRSTTAFGQKVFKPQDVWINNNKLTRVVSQRDLALMAPGYPTASTGTPTHWFTQGNSLVLYVTPAGVISNSYVAGWYLHPTLTQASDVLVIPDSDIEACAKECAIALIEPRATGDMLQTLSYLKQTLSAEKRALRARNINAWNPYPAKRLTRRVWSLR